MFLESYDIKSDRQDKMDPNFLSAIRNHKIGNGKSIAA